MMGGDAICNGKLGGSAVDAHVYCTQGGSMLDAQTSGKVFSSDYQKRNGSKPLTYAVSFYDGMMAIAQAMKKANSVDPAKYAPVLASGKYQGVAGVYEFDRHHDLKDSPVTVYRFDGGEPTALTSY